jgi:hypothetical protein
VHALYLAPREAALHLQVQSDQREGQCDRPRIPIRVLCGPGVHDVLVNELHVLQAERVVAQLIVCLRLATHARIITAAYVAMRRSTQSAAPPTG